MTKTNKKTAKAKTKKPVARRKKTTNWRIAAAQKAWITIRAKRAEAAKCKARPVAKKAVAPSTLAPAYTTAFRALATSGMGYPGPAPAIAVKPKLVKGLIKDTPLQEFERRGQFGVDNINARGITKDQIQGAVAAPIPSAVQVSSVQALFGNDASKWIQNDEAVDRNGNCVAPSDASAVKFCLTGALQKVYGQSTYYIKEQALAATIKQYTFGRVNNVTDFNDDPTTTFTDVRRVLLQAVV